MELISRLARRLQEAAHYLESPRLLALRRRGGIPGDFLALNQPWLHDLKIGTVLDIGAHIGQFAVTISAVLPEARIYAFEPLPDSFAVLQARLKNLPQCQALNFALGDQAGVLPLERSVFPASSSFLPMNEAHKSAFPYTRDSQPVSVEIKCLDQVAGQLAITDPLLIKLDVQGYEERVLRGGQQTVRRARLVIIETSFETLYEGQPLFADIYQLLTQWGFDYIGALGQLNHPQRGHPLQADSLYINRFRNP